MSKPSSFHRVQFFEEMSEDPGHCCNDWDKIFDETTSEDAKLDSSEL